MKIIHIITSLNRGGAEGNLFRLCKFQKEKYKKKIDILIITLVENGYYYEELKNKGINIVSLDINKKINFFNFIKSILKLRILIREQNPDVIQSWMYHSNFITLFIQRKFQNKLFWNIRHTKLNFQYSKKKTILLSIICSFFSNIIPRNILYCSDSSIQFHQNNHFYSKNKTSLIENGFDDKAYYPSKFERIKFRNKYKINSSDIVIGFAGRYTIEKNINSLIHAFAENTENYENLYLYMAGKDINHLNKKLSNCIKNLKLNKRIILLDEQKNLLEFYNGIDLLILTSHTESFPNVIAEAMLCSTLVLSSNAGCAKKIIGNYGFIMNNNDSYTISKNLKSCIDKFLYDKKIWEDLKKNSQLHIKKNYSIDKMSNLYLEEWALK